MSSVLYVGYSAFNSSVFVAAGGDYQIWAHKRSWACYQSMDGANYFINTKLCICIIFLYFSYSYGKIVYKCLFTILVWKTQEQMITNVHSTAASTRLLHPIHPILIYVQNFNCIPKKLISTVQKYNFKNSFAIIYKGKSLNAKRGLMMRKTKQGLWVGGSMRDWILLYNAHNHAH